MRLAMPGERRMSTVVRVTHTLTRGPRTIAQLCEITGASRASVADALRKLRNSQRVRMHPITREWRMEQ